MERDDETFECWCGESGTFYELFSGFSGGLEARCGGTGELVCYCGGDFCVCHNHGGGDCDGCPDCDPWGEP